MTAETTPVVVVLLVGPQASGKSTVATALAGELRQRGEVVALVELDPIAGTALPTLPSWEVAGQIFAAVAAEWARSGPTCVVAEGPSSRDEVSTVLDRLPAAAAVVVVAMTAPFETALQRAQADPTRERSRDREWLSERYDEWSTEIPRVGADLLIDSGALPVDQAVFVISAAIESARTDRQGPERTGHQNVRACGPRPGPR